MDIVKVSFTSIILFSTATYAETPSFTIERIGLLGDGYTTLNGGQDSEVLLLNNTGQAAGVSFRYKASDNSLYGYATWLYNGSTTVQIGLNGVGYTSLNGNATSKVGFLNDAGQAVGISYRYQSTDNTQYGQDTWLYNGTTTIKLGSPTDGYSSYISKNGTAFSYATGMNNAGQVIGYSKRYLPTDNNQYGQDAWLYNGTSTVKLGLTGVGYIGGSQGTEFSYAASINNAGQVAGYSNRYRVIGTGPYGTSAWVYNGNTTIQIGLTGVGYTSQSMESDSQVSTSINNAGQVAGYSTRFSSTTTASFGRDAWLYNGSTTIQIGLTGAGYNSGQFANSISSHINAAGQVTGTSARYKAGDQTQYGQDAWLYNGSKTVQIGLTGVGYTSQNGTANSTDQALNNAGQAAGISNRYKSANNTQYGQDAWFYNGNTTVQIGLTGAGYTSQDGTATSGVSLLNNAGLVAGFSNRYHASNNSGDYGRDAWLYDSTSNQTFNMTLATQPGSGYAYSEISYLGEDGLVLGYYSFYGLNTPTDHRAFYFKEGVGLFDLGTLTTDLSQDNWITLAAAIEGNGIGNIVGTGLFKGQQSNVTAAYILTPSSVPVPASIWFMGSGLLSLAGGRESAKLLNASCCS